MTKTTLYDQNSYLTDPGQWITDRGVADMFQDWASPDVSRWDPDIDGDPVFPDHYDPEDMERFAAWEQESDREWVESELRAYLDGGQLPSGEDNHNPNAGNWVVARGSATGWLGTSHGMIIYPDFDSLYSFDRGSMFADCDLDTIYEENGSLHIEGTHHDGGVSLEVRQLTNEAYNALMNSGIDLWGGELDIDPDEEITIGGKTYQMGDESQMLHDMWDNPDLLPPLNYVSTMRGRDSQEADREASRSKETSTPSLDDKLQAAAKTTHTTPSQQAPTKTVDAR